MLAYHGTGIKDPEQLRREGLKPLNPREVAARVLEDYAPVMHRLPKYLKEKHVAREIQYREEQGAVVHLTLCKNQAERYSRHAFGGEFETSLRYNFDRALGGKSAHWDPPEGSSTWVVVVEIPENTPTGRNETIANIRARVERHLEESFEEFASHTAWDIKVFEIRPEQIVDIIEVKNRP